MERTLVLIKPDAVEQNIIGKIISFYEDAGLKIIALKMEQVERKVAEEVLDETKFDVKLAIFMILSGLNINEAKEKLSKNKGYIAKAMENI